MLGVRVRARERLLDAAPDDDRAADRDAEADRDRDEGPDHLGDRREGLLGARRDGVGGKDRCGEGEPQESDGEGRDKPQISRREWRVSRRIY